MHAPGPQEPKKPKHAGGSGETSAPSASELAERLKRKKVRSKRTGAVLACKSTHLVPQLGLAAHAVSVSAPTDAVRPAGQPALECPPAAVWSIAAAGVDVTL